MVPSCGTCTGSALDFRALGGKKSFHENQSCFNFQNRTQSRDALVSAAAPADFALQAASIGETEI